MAFLNFDPNTVSLPERADYSPLPDGHYNVEITNAEVKPFKNGGGGLSIEYTVVEPVQYARRKVWQIINIEHANERAVEIGMQTLAKLCLAAKINVKLDNDNYQSLLFGKIVRVRTKIKQREGYDPRAEVVDIQAAGAGEPAKPQQAALTSAPKRPWA